MASAARHRFLSYSQKTKAPSPLRSAGALQRIVERFDAEGNPFQLPSRIETRAVVGVLLLRHVAETDGFLFTA